MTIPLPRPLDEVHVFMGERNDDHSRFAAPAGEYYSADDLRAYGDERELSAIAKMVPDAGTFLDNMKPLAGAASSEWQDGWNDCREQFMTLAPPSGEVVEPRDKPMKLAVALSFADTPRRYPSLMCPADTTEELYEALRVLAAAYRDATTPQAAPVDGDADQPAGGWDAVDADNGFRRYPWTYQNQPGNVGASVLGGACNQASAASAGDTIDRGLGLLKALHERGFGIVRVPKIAVQDTTPPPASQERGVAPWPDFAGNPIHAGDRIKHPDGVSGTVVYLPMLGPGGEAWRVVYDGEVTLSRLNLQIGDKGQAVVASPPSSAAASLPPHKEG